MRTSAPMAKANSINLSLRVYAILATHANALGLSKRQMVEKLTSEYLPFGSLTPPPLRGPEDPQPVPQTLAESCAQGAGIKVEGLDSAQLEEALRAQGHTPRQVAEATCKELNDALNAWQAKQKSKGKAASTPKPTSAPAPKPTSAPEPESAPSPKSTSAPPTSLVGVPPPTPAPASYDEEPGRPPVTGAGYGVF